MNTPIAQLAAEVAEATGAELPPVLDEDSPALRAGDSPAQQPESFYLIGLIGGKDVGKSALVNALVGERVTDSTSYGPGTDTVIAYAHKDQAQPLRELLEREAPGRYKIVPHRISTLQRQVLLDLPDIDSQYTDHIELTRRMLRHMLFPIWVQSVEKYADQQPQKLLAAVAAGNDPANFVFCLNKCDQLGKEPLAELRDDYAARIARVLKQSATPKVFLVSAIQPQAFDLPALREKLAQQKSAATVKQSIELAGRQHERSVLAWLETQQLPERASRLKRLEEQADDLVASRLSSPLLEGAVPRILDDPAHRAAMVDEVMSARVARWPVVNVIHTLLLPVTSIWRYNVGAGPSAEALVASKTEDGGRSLSASVQATFALLQQTHPAVGPLYRRAKLWDEMTADGAAAELRQSLVAGLEGQRAAAIGLLARRGLFMPIMRWALTIGAILWFPIIQPVLERFLDGSLVTAAPKLALLAVELLGAAYLLKSAAFLAIWFLALWLVLRWDTQRRVTKLLARWRRPDGKDASINLAAIVLEWCDGLLDPIHRAREREESLAKRADELRKQINSPAAA